MKLLDLAEIAHSIPDPTRTSLERFLATGSMTDQLAFECDTNPEIRRLIGSLLDAQGLLLAGTIAESGTAKVRTQIPSRQSEQKNY